MRLRVTSLILYAKASTVAGFQHCASVPCFPNSLQVPEGKGFIIFCTIEALVAHTIPRMYQAVNTSLIKTK